MYCNAAASLVSAAEKPIGMVVLLGVGMVFVGLIAIILICKIMGLIFASGAKRKKAAPAITRENAVKPVENREEIIAAVSAAVAEELGKDVSALKILSFKRIS